jgi:glycosyltransferase involved in cell wall biosynthesis
VYPHIILGVAAWFLRMTIITGISESCDAAEDEIPAPGDEPVLAMVDVVIPCYNYARYLRGCVQSVLTQPGVDVRVLVIDDASSDETAEIGQQLAASDSRVNFRRHEVNKGHIATYNEGLIDWSTADYTVLLSADDLLAPGSLSRAVRVMEADKTIGMVYGRAVHFFQEAELPTIEACTSSYTRYSGVEWLEGRCRSGHNVITSPEVVVRGSIQRMVGGYRPDLPHAGDLEMWLRVAAVSNIAYIRDVPQAFYRVHAASMQRTKYQSSLSDFVQRKAAFNNFFLHHDTIRNAGRLHDMANRALAREALWDVCRTYDHNQVEQARVNELVEFALFAYPEATSLSEYAALRRRQRLGPALCNRSQLFVVPASIRWISRWVRKQSWKRRGI